MKNHENPEGISRRAFLKEVSLAAGGASLFSMAFLAGCNSSAETTFFRLGHYRGAGRFAL